MVEGTLQKFRPGAISALAYPLLGLDSLRGRGQRRCHARAPWTRRGEYPRVVDRVESRWRHAGCEPAEEREWIHVNRDRPIRVRLLQGDANEAVGLLLHSLLRDRRA